METNRRRNTYDVPRLSSVTLVGNVHTPISAKATGLGWFLDIAAERGRLGI
jgi:hypothetical protein